jgi:hypothetical protein
MEQIKISKLAELVKARRTGKKVSATMIYSFKLPLTCDDPQMVGAEGVRILEKKGYNCQSVWEYWSKGKSNGKD